MFARMINYVIRPQLSSALIFSRNLASAFGGTLFTLFNVFEVPPNLLPSYFPALSTFLISIILFFRKLKEQYDESDPENPSLHVKKAERLLSTGFIVNLLNKEADVSQHFLQHLHLNESEISRLQHWTDKSDDHLQDVFDKMYNEMQWGFEKYSMSTLLAIFTMAAHFMEVMLLKVYHDSNLFSFEEGASYANVALCLMGVAALLDGIVEFDNTKYAYEHPAPSLLCNTIFKSYQKYHEKFVSLHHDERHEVALTIR